MTCDKKGVCGGCKYREMPQSQYIELKTQNFLKTLKGLKKAPEKINPPVFVSDGSRRRITLTFSKQQKKLVLGFNKEASAEIADLDQCPLCTPKINAILPNLRNFLGELCAEVCAVRHGKKIQKQSLSAGDIFIGEVDNGLDIVLETKTPLSLTQKMIVSDFCNREEGVVRFSWRPRADEEAETLIEKTKPVVKMGRYTVLVPAGTFLQPSKEGQKVLSDLVMKYLHGVEGSIADLFCGVGTFSYELADLPKVKITAVDSSKPLLEGFQKSVCQNQIKNISVLNKNLFKYPPTEEELKEFKALVFDPPRAGAKALCQAIASARHQPEKIVALSCNPQTFVNDANMLIEGGYLLKEITMVDQFIYSNHSEAVAFFTK